MSLSGAQNLYGSLQRLDFPSDEREVEEKEDEEETWDDIRLVKDILLYSNLSMKRNFVFLWSCRASF